MSIGVIVLPNADLSWGSVHGEPPPYWRWFPGGIEQVIAVNGGKRVLCSTVEGDPVVDYLDRDGMSIGGDPTPYLGILDSPKGAYYARIRRTWAGGDADT